MYFCLQMLLQVVRMPTIGLLGVRIHLPITLQVQLQTNPVSSSRSEQVGSLVETDEQPTRKRLTLGLDKLQQINKEEPMNRTPGKQVMGASWQQTYQKNLQLFPSFWAFSHYRFTWSAAILSPKKSRSQGTCKVHWYNYHILKWVYQRTLGDIDKLYFFDLLFCNRKFWCKGSEPSEAKISQRSDERASVLCTEGNETQWIEKG